eukprot:CAMPEP_0176497724 /NCGR_PEP_ID=MMETSP0200_2-20121128/11888_1 /TAXON_ID=947934 /ORGANISM="Chaetoceros sp., Strain GSL56" /LENGTH=92 /DNA_ID=CAMNT_0017895779 /DNA_START=581 /DNA_END=859 /DNA_ORIENTATION=+
MRHAPISLESDIKLYNPIAAFGKDGIKSTDSPGIDNNPMDENIPRPKFNRLVVEEQQLILLVSNIFPESVMLLLLTDASCSSSTTSDVFPPG